MPGSIQHFLDLIALAPAAMPWVRELRSQTLDRLVERHEQERRTAEVLPGK